MALHHETWAIVIVNSGLVGTSNGNFVYSLVKSELGRNALN